MGDWQARFPEQPPLIMCVNVSSKQFFQAGLVEQVELRLRESGMAGSSLKLEITESAIMKDPAAAADLLGRLRSLGVRISIDDFGTGYSSLSYLRRFPIDTLKIDRSFVHRMESDSKDLEIVQTILTLAHNLAMDVVAEGVETHLQRDRLQTLGCEHGQGFYFSRSMCGPDAEVLLANNLRRPGGRPDARDGHIEAPGPPVVPTLEPAGSPGTVRLGT
jgi:EAL domain-containing protein (putative c-di-GMP-specific phosphodiesterase class I)